MEFCLKSGRLVALLALTVFIMFIQRGIYAQDGLMLSAELSGHSSDLIYGSSYIPSSPSGYLTFPNAFRWNHEGPTGGFWSENNVDDCTFRPFFSNIAIYKLEIFNRSGFRVFESSDLNKGWDGYLRDGTVAKQGVYIWKAAGKFNDGLFYNRIGDVTFLH